MKKVRTNYEDYSQADLEDFIGHTTICLTGNANFPTLPKPLADITTKFGEWKDELSKSKLGSHEATTKAQTFQSELVRMLKINGDYINNTAAGNLAMLETCGYVMAKDPVYQPKPNVKIVQGQQSGSGTVVIEAIPDAVVYLVEICGDPLPAVGNTSVWIRLKLSTKATLPFSGLEPRKLYWVRFCYVTIEDESPYCQPVSFSIV